MAPKRMQGKSLNSALHDLIQRTEEHSEDPVQLCNSVGEIDLDLDDVMNVDSVPNTIPEEDPNRNELQLAECAFGSQGHGRVVGLGSGVTPRSFRPDARGGTSTQRGDTQNALLLEEIQRMREEREAEKLQSRRERKEALLERQMEREEAQRQREMEREELLMQREDEREEARRELFGYWLLVIND
ncbi:uncharacterized protein LOC124930593 [Impatiens glandulifera]|uniref:uncharacterized protein LOC124930593 n=1 Tax=Impatiens glandulifera TaxID=253017 RepID=UPI001FB19F31|nr:uncharacterized protein LOC124930593 [Impatiens glandulifera]